MAILLRQKACYLFGLVLVFSFFTSSAGSAAEDLNRQIENLAKDLTSSKSGDVLDASGDEVYISLGIDQGVVQGNKFEIVRFGEPLEIGGKVIGYKETKIAEVEVTRSRDKISICNIIENNEMPQKGDKVYQLRKKIKRLVVGQFSYNQSFNSLTKNLQDKLYTVMSGRGIQVVERDQLERVLDEQKLGYSGLININTAKKIGELLGAEGILLGSVNDMGNSININARLVDIESGNTISAAETELPKTPLIAQLLSMSVENNSVKKISAVSNGGASPKTSSKELPFFENDLFRVDVISFQRVGGSVELKLKYTNITKNVIDLELNQPYENTYLVSDAGNQYPFKESELEEYRGFPAGVPRIIIISFRDIKGTGNHFVASIKVYIPGHSTRFFINFKNLVLE